MCPSVRFRESRRKLEATSDIFISSMCCDISFEGEIVLRLAAFGILFLFCRYYFLFSSRETRYDEALKPCKFSAARDITRCFYQIKFCASLPVVYARFYYWNFTAETQRTRNTEGSEFSCVALFSCLLLFKYDLVLHRCRLQPSKKRTAAGVATFGSPFVDIAVA